MAEIIIGTPIIGTIEEFIDISLTIVLLFMIYYVIRFIFAGGETEEQLQQRRERFGHWLGQQREERETRRRTDTEVAQRTHEVQQRRRLLHPVVGFLIRAQENAEEITRDLRSRTASGASRAESHLDRVESNLRSAVRTLRAAQIRTHGDHRQHIGAFLAYAQSIGGVAHNSIRGHIPEDERDPRWDTRVHHIEAAVGNVRTYCGNLITALDEYMEQGRYTALGAIAAGHATTSTGSHQYEVGSALESHHH